MCCAMTHVLVLLLAHKQDLFQEIWMGTSRTKRYISVHKIALPEEKRRLLLAFHTITGCDISSQFAGIGKQSEKSSTVHRSSSNIKVNIVHQRKVSQLTLKHLCASCTTMGQTEWISTKRERQHFPR